MDKCVLGNTDETVSRLGFGCMRFPEKDGEIDFDKSSAMIDYAYRNGVNYFDTAYIYHGGKSERFLGKALSKYPRDSYHIATKLPLWDCNSEDSAERIFNEQLERLNTDYIDFYLLHNFMKNQLDKVEKFKLIDFCIKKKTEGKIKHLGFSMHDSPEFLEEVLKMYDWEFVQLQVNYIDWKEQRAEESCSMLKERGIPLVVMEPVRGGGLAVLPDEVSSIFKGVNPDDSIAKWAFRWVINKTNASVVLSGMSTMEQVEDNINTFSPCKAFTEEEQTALDQAIDEINNRPVVPCTGCSYCMPCPAGVKIPNNISALNEYIKFGNANTLKWRYNDELKDGERADSCIKCGACTEKCPQRLDIPDIMSRVDTTVKSL